MGMTARSGAILLLLACVALTLPGSAGAAPRTKVVHFEGLKTRVPASWPVYRLARHPRLCVRLDRRAVYLGTPGAAQRCPSHAVGRRRAVVLDPAGKRARAGASEISPLPTTTPTGSSGPGGSVFTGLGFDACAAPSSRAMAAWAKSPYRAVGVYIGGLNRACSQPNLTARWVREQVAEGWHLIPTYVGLQAPTSSCGSCAKLKAGTASAQGRAAARDAVLDARAIAMGPGSPLYFDMESYSQTVSATNATLNFLEGWTLQLHSLGYQSGVYSSSASGIEDLVSRLRTLYRQPDHIWIANWNGKRTTADPFVPSFAWNRRQRIHQYRGGHDERWGGVTINIDNNYLDGGTVGPATGPRVPPPLAVSRVKPQAGTIRVRVRCGWEADTSCPGRIIVRTKAKFPIRTRGRRGGRIVRLAIGRKAFRLRGGRSHTFRLYLNSHGRPLLRQRGTFKAQLLVAIPDSREARVVRFSRAR